MIISFSLTSINEYQQFPIFPEKVRTFQYPTHKYKRSSSIPMYQKRQILKNKHATHDRDTSILEKIKIEKYVLNYDKTTMPQKSSGFLFDIAVRRTAKSLILAYPHLWKDLAGTTRKITPKQVRNSLAFNNNTFPSQARCCNPQDRYFCMI